MVPLSYYLILSAILFTIGAIGVLIKKNPIIMFMCIELMLNAVNLTFIAFSRQLNLLNGQVFVLFIMTIAAAEVSIGLAIIITIFRGKKTIDVDEVNLMKE